jgi:Tfp pilus assembly protein PilO
MNLKLTKRTLFLTIVLSLFAAANMILLWIWWGNYKSNSQLEKIIQEKQAIVTALETTALVEEPSPEEIERVEALLPISDNQPRWIHDVQSVVRKTGVAVKGIHFERAERAAEEPPAVQMLYSDIHFEGNLQQIQRAIQEIQKLGRITHLQNWSLVRKENLTFSLQVRLATYYHQP